LTSKISNSGVQFCFACLAAGLAGLALSRLGQLWDRLDVFAQFAPQFMFLVVAGLAGLFAPAWRKTLCVALLALMVLGYGVWPHAETALAKPAAEAAGEQRITVASFNTWLLNPHPEAVRDEVLRLNADVVVLIEVSARTLAALQSISQTYPYQYDCAGQSFCHLAILSKFPLRDASSKTSWAGPPMIRATLGGAADGITIVGVHTTRFPYSRAQLKQATTLSAELSLLPRPLIVMGDFNATPLSRVTQVIAAGGGLTRQTSLPTWPSHAGLPQIAIDHIFTSAGIKPLQREIIGRPSGSDHYPISMVLAVP
jgi:endonuclease/exonuclease/phosphatase (EEP) superfamily protein YafD